MTIQNPPPYTTTPAMTRSKSTFSLRSSKRSVSTSSTELPPPPLPSKSFFFSSKSKPNPNSAELSKPMNRLIKSLKKCVSNREVVSKDEIAVASQLAEWGSGTNDDSLATLGTHLSTVLAAIANQENYYASRLEAARGQLKSIRSTEQSVGKSRLAVLRLREELQRAKIKNEESRCESLAQELERAEAQSLVAESQLSNVSRQKLKSAYSAQLHAVIERAEKSAMLAKQGIRLLNLLDDTPLIPPAERAPFEHDREVRAILSEAEEMLREWTPEELDIGVGLAVSQQPYPEHLRFPGATSPQVSSAAAGGMRRVNPEMDVHPMRRAATDINTTLGSSSSSGHSSSGSGSELDSPSVPAPWGQGMYCASPVMSNYGSGRGDGVKSPSVGSASEYSSYSAGSSGSNATSAVNQSRRGAGMRSVSQPAKIRYMTESSKRREVSSGGPEGYNY